MKRSIAFADYEHNINNSNDLECKSNSCMYYEDNIDFECHINNSNICSACEYNINNSNELECKSNSCMYYEGNIDLDYYINHGIDFEYDSKQQKIIDLKAQANSTSQSTNNKFYNTTESNKNVTTHWEHRRLDAIARLIHHYSSINPGSVAVILQKVSLNSEKLVIATKRPVESVKIKNIIKFILQETKKLSGYMKIDANIKHTYQKIQELLVELKQSNSQNHIIKNIYAIRDVRAKLDLFKLTKAIYCIKDNKHMPNISKIFKENTIEILENNTMMHPELLISDYINNTKIITEKSKYIGSSIVTCKKCSLLIKGTNTAFTDDIIGFNEISPTKITTRGHSEYGYPNYTLLMWSKQVNSNDHIHYTLNRSSKSLDCLNIKELFIVSNPELSDSEDDNCYDKSRAYQGNQN